MRATTTQEMYKAQTKGTITNTADSGDKVNSPLFQVQKIKNDKKIMLSQEFNKTLAERTGEENTSQDLDACSPRMVASDEAGSPRVDDAMSD